MSRLQDRVALVTGGGSGIGRAACRLLAEHGARVVVTDIDGPRAADTAAAIGAPAESVELDVTSETQWQRTTKRIAADYGGLNILVNCAGVGINGVFEETLLEDWNSVLAVNLTGVFLGCKHGIHAMKAREPVDGSIINISSIAGVVGGGDIAAYSASKGGVTTLTKSVALSCAERSLNIRCNSIHPTYVDSEMLDPVAEHYPSREAMCRAMSENIPIGRMATPGDIANAILFLASGDSSMITGTALMVDGGTTAGVPSKHAAAD